MFGTIDGAAFRATTRYIERQVSALNERMAKGLLFENREERLETILAGILPPDDGALRFVSGGVGITESPETTLSNLFSRYVCRYESPSEIMRRSDDDVWRVFREPLEKKSLISHLGPKTITAPNYEYPFQRSWKNGVWHVYEPVSLDLVDGGSILEKANKWLGRATSLADSVEPFKLFLLLGEPGDAKLGEAFKKAQNILAKMPVQRELVRESEAEQFADEAESAFQAHMAEEYS
jgi:hypothetical protein